MARLFDETGGILLREALIASRAYARPDMQISPSMAEGGLFTAAERRLIPLILKGAPNKEIAACLDMPMTSVKMNLRNLCRKLHVSNRTQAAIALHDMLRD